MAPFGSSQFAPVDDDFWGGIGQPVPVGSGQTPAAADQNPGGFDPFNYTLGSLLTPWTREFVAPPGSGGGYSPPAFTPFQFNQFGYNYRPPDAYSGFKEFQAPDAFGYQAFEGAPAFKGITEADLQADPSYQFRKQAGQDALESSAAARGLLRSGGTAKALADYNQQAASQEYGNVYNRKASEYDRAAQLARADYATNRANAAENYDRNFQTGLAASEANNRNRLAAYQASTDANIRGNQLGYDIAQGTYDRNLALARQQWQDQANAAAAAASAGSANANQSYDRAMREYMLAHDLFQENQANQYNRLMGLAELGMRGSGAQGGYGSEYGGTLGNLYTGIGNAQAGSKMAQGNAWATGLGNLGNAAIGLYGMATDPYGGGGYPRSPQPRVQLPGQYIPPPSVPTRYY